MSAGTRRVTLRSLSPGNFVVESDYSRRGLLIAVKRSNVMGNMWYTVTWLEDCSVRKQVVFNCVFMVLQ